MYVATKTELRNNFGLIDECLQKGELLVITSRGAVIGIVTPDIPPEVAERFRVKGKRPIPFAHID